MNAILEALTKTFQLFLSVDPRILEITIRALFVSGMAAIIATLWGIPIALLIGLQDFRGKTLVKTIFSALLGIPTVAMGLILFLAFSKAGPLGILGLLYTPTGIIIGEALLITPIIVSIATTAIEAVDREILNLAKTLGASESQQSTTILKEALSGILLATIAAFNRAIAELGVAQMVGGNIQGATEVLTTAISNETQRGNFQLSITLGIILLSIVFGITLALNLIQRRRK
ncbi:MAG TPA: ABC transporter permease [Candidatus Krumholzibacteriaceae bacterium]|nr:ABC transporter permease [Candidatus Krumholzibacteriaceae bacterium]